MEFLNGNHNRLNQLYKFNKKIISLRGFMPICKVSRIYNINKN